MKAEPTPLGEGTGGEKRQRAAQQRPPRCAGRRPAPQRALTERPPPAGPTSPPPPGTPLPRIPSCFPGLPTSLPAAVTSRNIFGSSCRRRGDAWLAPRSRPRNAEQTSPPTPGISDVPARRRFGMATAAWPGWGCGTACPVGPIPESWWLCRAVSRPAGDLGLVLFGPRGRRPAACPQLGWEQRWQDLPHPEVSAHPAWAHRCAGRWWEGAARAPMVLSILASPPLPAPQAPCLSFPIRKSDIDISGSIRPMPPPPCL